MEHTSVNIGTVNINTITNTTKLNALRTLVRTLDLDIIFLQEVENDQLTLAGYNVVCNVDHMRRGTAIALKEHIKYSHVERSLDGRLLALRIHNTTLCNVYAPSGTVHRAERERFFNNTIAYYLRHRTDHVILGGDFNCVIRQRDATGNNPSPALQATIQQMRLHDVWPLLRSRETGFTYITHNSSSRLDRFYVSASLREQLRATAVHACCFSDHMAVTKRICIPLPDRAHGCGFWSLLISSPPKTSTIFRFVGNIGHVNVATTNHGWNGGCNSLNRKSHLSSVGNRKRFLNDSIENSNVCTSNCGKRMTSTTTTVLCWPPSTVSKLKCSHINDGFPKCSFASMKRS